MSKAAVFGVFGVVVVAAALTLGAVNGVFDRWLGGESIRLAEGTGDGKSVETATPPKPAAGGAAADADAAATPRERETGSDAVATVRRPTVDIVRVEPSGDAVIAGQSDAGALVAVLSNGAVVGKGIASETGDWAIVLEQPLKPGSHDIAVEARKDEASQSVVSDVVIAVHVPVDESEGVLVATSRPDAPTEIVQVPAGEAGAVAERVEGATTQGGAEVAAAGAGAVEPSAADQSPNQIAALMQPQQAKPEVDAANPARPAAPVAPAGETAAATPAAPVASAAPQPSASAAPQAAPSGAPAPAADTRPAAASEPAAADPAAARATADPAAAQATADPAAAPATADPTAAPAAGGPSRSSTNGAVLSAADGSVPSTPAPAPMAENQDAEQAAERGAAPTVSAGTIPAPPTARDPSAPQSQDDAGVEVAAAPATDAGARTPDPAAAAAPQAGPTPNPTSTSIAAVETRTADPAAAAEDRTAASGQPAAPGAADEAQITVDAVEVEKGKVYVAGRSSGKGPVRVYIEDKYVGEVEPNPSGQWLLTAPETIETGEHTVRADKVKDKAGAVAARAEVVFERDPDEVSLTRVAATGSGAAGVAAGAEADAGRRRIPALIIRKGDSLWRISRRHYGSGFRYTTIYQANQKQIRDPDLIFPGQVFLLPERDLNWTGN